MIPTHTSTVVDPLARGREFGARWRSAVHATVDGYLALFHGDPRVRGWSLAALSQTAAWAPALALEMTGIALGAGLEPWQVAAVNARTEILAALRDTGDGECSTAVALTGAEPRTVQTWDWYDHLRDVPVLWAFDSGTGVAVRTFTEFGVLAKIGVNSAGLGVHFNILRHVSDHSRIGVPVHLVARRVLAEATTVEEAAAVARSARVSASTALTVVTAGAAATIELSPAGVAVVPAGGVLVRTNHFLDADLAVGERLGVERPLTYDRLAHLRAHAAELASGDVTARARGLLSHAPDGAPVCAHADPALPFDQRWETVATIALDVTTTQIHVHEGGPCRVTDSTWQTFP